MNLKMSGEEFERLSWHDNYLYGLHFLCEKWDCNLLLDIDHIVEWICGVDGGAQFRIAPATLIFHDVTDLKMNIDWGDSGFQIGLHQVSIDRIERERIENQKICLDRPYYRWLIATNFPAGGTIVFGASGFTQLLRAEPVISDEQQLSASNRPALNLAQAVRDLLQSEA